MEASWRPGLGVPRPQAGDTAGQETEEKQQPVPSHQVDSQNLRISEGASKPPFLTHFFPVTGLLQLLLMIIFASGSGKNILG